MIRILFAAALGGTISLGILLITGSDRFLPWAGGFFTATALLLPALFISGGARKSRQKRTAIAEAQQQGRTRTALILDRSQTGLLVNEQPQVEFTLLVDRPDDAPFIATVREIVEVIHLHETIPGAVVSVAHPDPKYGEIYLLGTSSTSTADAPAASRTLTPDLASEALRLPAKPSEKARGKRSGWITVVALAVGLVGAPFLATPTPLKHVQYLLSGKEGSVDRVDHPVLFEPDELVQSLETLTAEFGHDEVVSIHVSDVRLVAEVPVALSSSQITRVTVQDHQITDQEPSDASADPEAVSFSTGDIDWQAVFARVPEAAEHVTAQGVSEPVLHAVSAARDRSTLARIEVRLDFTAGPGFGSGSGSGSGSVYLTADGELSASEQFGTLSDEERATYFYDADRFVAAIEEMLDEVGTTEIIKIGNHGDRLYLTAYVDAGQEPGRSVEVTYHDGQVSDVEAPQSLRGRDVDRFILDDLDWEEVYGSISEAQRAMADAGAADTQPTHILVERDSASTSHGDRPYARIYLSNEFGDGGYVFVYGDGSLGRIMGP